MNFARRVLPGISAALVGGILSAGIAAANPIFDGRYADPQIRLYGDAYWIFPTASAPFGMQTSFDAFSSRDMKTWTKHPRILTTNEVTWAKGAMWAPDAHEVGGKYYLFFSANDSYPQSGRREDGEPKSAAALQGYGGIGVAVADRPEGPYRDLIGKPLIDRFWNRAQPIDQYVFEYKGEWYMIYGGWRRCNLVKLARDFKSLAPFEDGAMWRDMTPKGYVEGSVMFERKGRWYFMYSAGSWTRDDYCVNYSAGDSPFGPFTFKGKVLGVQKPLATGAGHHSVICKPGTDEWYICYHRRPIPSEGRNHRVVCIDRMEFDANGDIKPVVMTERKGSDGGNSKAWLSDGCGRGAWFRGDGLPAAVCGGARADNPTSAVKVVQWNIGHFAHGLDKRTAIAAEDSAAQSAEYRAMIGRLKPDFLGVSEFDPVFDKAGRLSTNEVFASFPTRILGPKSHYQCNALFTRFPCLRHEAVDFDERRQKTYFIDAVFLFGTNEVHFVQTHLDWARLPDENERPREDRRFAQRQIKQLVEHFKDVPYVIISADFNVSRRWHFKEFDKAGYTVANNGRYDLLDNVVVKGFDVKDLFSADDERRLSDHRIVGCVIEMRR